MCSEISTLEKGYEGKLSKRIYSFILKEFETGKVSQSFPQFVASFQFFDEINQRPTMLFIIKVGQTIFFCRFVQVISPNFGTPQPSC